MVVEFPVQVGEEAQLFGAYLSKFMEHFSDDADRWADQCDAPYVMVRSDPLQGREVKVLTFQLRSAAPGLLLRLGARQGGRRPQPRSGLILETPKTFGRRR